MHALSEGLTWSQDELADLAESTLARARAGGADHAHVHISEARGISVQIRQRETVSQTAHANQRITLTVYRDGRTAQAASANFSQRGIDMLASAACDAVQLTEADRFAGPTEAAYLVGRESTDDLELYDPPDWTISDLAARAREAEDQAFAQSSKIVGSEGASCASVQMQSRIASTEGLAQGYRASMRSLSCAAIASDGATKRIGGHGHSARFTNDLMAASEVGSIAAARAVGQLGARSLDTRTCAVLYDARVATQVLGQYLGAAQGGVVVNKASMFEGKLDQRVCGAHLNAFEDASIPRGLASRPFDSDGVASRQRELIERGILRGFMMSAYSARRLGMRPTGNADGPNNVSITSARTAEYDDLTGMLRKLGTGLYVTSVFSGGFNSLTGEYSQAAEGFWVEHGEIQFPVDGVTIASDARSMLGDECEIGADRHTSGAITTGSLLISQMRLAGR
ncbi:TldD/PmbA family protein [Pararobbsia silviterrae]|nr:metallopeptidase TldD-related protein [Pararobbsia silviterrae]